MMPGMNPRQMQKAMQRMGIKQEEIDASEVIIKTPEKNLVIKNPQVTKVDMMGQKTFQVIGEVTEESSISEEDIKTVAEQAEVSEEQAKEALQKTSGDLAEAILELKKE
ncbi:nascent polypeptide-associated complex protein [archaeon]|nr:nascent polypeptide-associated complex protein [archaeon]